LIEEIFRKAHFAKWLKIFKIFPVKNISDIRT
jgi:hypothetical protein